jgi:sterol desaturase/sphingolipid hydroxylase (fatty acid hydroxylase superfamily)
MKQKILRAPGHGSSGLNLLLTGGMIAALLWLERRRPLRPRIEGVLQHETRNFTLSLISVLSKKAVEALLTRPLIHALARRKSGVLDFLPLPGKIKNILAFALLDYTVYIGHMLAHKIPLLWRFHQVHHEDLDLTTSTGLRMHFGEAIVSSLFRSLQVAVVGASIQAFRVWRTFSQLALLFHHSNLKLKIDLEQKISHILVTPRLHAIHHSIVPAEVNSNWSTGLTLWDWLHGTLIPSHPHKKIVIGVAAYSDPEQVKLSKLLVQPFRPRPGTARQIQFD